MSLLRRLFFDLWYLGRPPWDSGISPPELLTFLDEQPPGRAIDLGCGTGTNVLTLARRGWQVTGVDFAPRAIALARKKLRAAGVQADLQVGDVTRLDGINGPFNFALDLGCFHGLSDPDKARYLDQLERILAPGGFWMMYGIFTPPGSSQMRLAETDIERAQARFTLLRRQDGTDRGGTRKSAYFLFQK
ncbi:MAG: class I SAM-dependent methyltransferase [Anaerolineales bacterium]